MRVKTSELRAVGRSGAARAAGVIVGALLLSLAGAIFSSESRAAEGGPKAAITFNKQVVRIFQDHCQSCHHPGGIAPFSLMTYPDAFRNRKAIRKETVARKMPPWKAAPGCSAYQNDRSLKPEVIQTISQWVTAGAPEGDRRDLPPPRTFASDWDLGEPDLTLTMKAPRTPDFSNGDEFRCFVFPTSVPDDRWVSAVAVRPGNPKMVHHALVWIEDGSSSEKLIERDPAGSYSCFGSPVVPIIGSIGEWVPGGQPHRFPDGVGRRFPKKSRVIIQIHYSAHYAQRARASGPDRTSLGIYFAKAPVKHPVEAQWVYGPDKFVIPAGAKNFILKGSLSNLPAMELLAVFPHMHLLGRTMGLTATLPDGTKRCLIDIDDWDFHWQRTYWFREPITLPAGTRFDLTANYDNSLDNPDNPSNPPRDAMLGMETTNEMCQIALYYTVKEPRPNSK